MFEKELLEQNGNGWFFAIIIVFCIGIIEMISQTCMKNGALNGQNDRFLFCGIAGYIMIAYILWRTFRFRGMGEVNLLWNCVTTISSAVIGYYLFSEKMNRYTYYAIFFAVLAIYFSYLSDKN